jgi:hypothetical protein
VFSTTLGIANAGASRASGYRVTALAKTVFQTNEQLTLAVGAGGEITNLRANLLFKADLTS